jgi:acyl-CoA reductase-like NAD-dependent aldehyde dehydrogenase
VRTAKGLFGGAFANSGQVCLAVKRAYVHDSIYDRVVDELSDLARAAVVGDGLQQGTQFGPLQNRMQYDRVRELLDDAKLHGTVAAEGNTPEGPGYFIAPTIVRDLPDDAPLVREEQFGPVLPVLSFDSVDEAIARANDTRFGLGASVWCRDEAISRDVAGRLMAGTVWINRHGLNESDVPFGGMKESGYGREHGVLGIRAYQELQVISRPTS